MESVDEMSLAIADSYYKYLRNEKVKENKIIKKIISERTKRVQTEENGSQKVKIMTHGKQIQLMGNMSPKI